MQQVNNSVQPWQNAIASTETKFKEFNYLDFGQEQIFATQALMGNDYLLDIAKKNPGQLKLAMYNVAALGLSLNPNQGLAYLIPRKGKVIVDISYRGLITLGVECGAIRWAKAELVYTNDEFVYKGPADKPVHNCDPFSTNRGDVRGGYCIAELTTGGVLVQSMSKADMDKIKQSSEAFKKGYGPWIEWEDQMQLKSIVKRAYKWWPKSTPRMAEAMRILNEENGEGLAVIEHDNNTSGALPPPPPREKISIAVQNTVNQLVTRAAQANAYEACKELMESRLKNPEELSFALSELEKKKLETEGTTQNAAA